MSQGQAADGGECVICVGPLGSSSPGRFGLSPNCGHVFCGLCLARWHRREKSCHVCRADCAGIVTWPRVDLTPRELEELYSLQNADLFTQQELDQLQMAGRAQSGQGVQGGHGVQVQIVQPSARPPPPVEQVNVLPSNSGNLAINMTTGQVKIRLNQGNLELHGNNVTVEIGLNQGIVNTYRRR